MLQGFAEKDMIEQITILDDIKESGQTEALPELLELYASPMADQAVDEMVYHTLFEVMSGQSQEIIAGLKHPSARVQTICIRRAGEDGDTSVQPAVVEFLKGCTDPEMTSEVLRTLGGFRDPELTKVISPYIENEDDSVAAWAMHSLVDLGTAQGRAALQDMVKQKAQQTTSDIGCQLKTAQAISSVASYKDEAAADFLVENIHHPVPCFRRVVVSSLAEMGEVVLPAMGKCFESGDKDEKIMAANIVGWTGHKKGADLLNAVLDQNGSLDINFKFAIYEALGRIPSVRSFIGLADGLKEPDEMVMMAVVTGLNDLCNPGIIKVLNELFDEGGAQANLVLQTIVTGHAAKIFKAVYTADNHGNDLIETIINSGDKDAVEFFTAELEKIDTDIAQADIKRLSLVESAAAHRKIVAADDSRAMLFFYKGVAADLGLELVTARDGKEALDYFQSATDIDMLITDMNMPNMDGIELTKELRKMPQWEKLPILMATTESEKTQADLATAAGVNGFLSKPFGKEDFKNKVTQFL